MSQTWGLTQHGFKAKDFDAIKNELESTLRKEVDPALNFGNGTVAGQLTAIMSNQARQVWEAAHDLYHSLRPDTASGAALESLCSLTGTYRLLPKKTLINVQLTLNPNTTVVKDSRIKTLGGHFFRLLKEAKNEANTVTEIEREFLAEEYGPFTANIDTKAEIMTGVSGWTKATVKEIVVLGRLKETDDELRIRRIVELKAKGSSSFDAIHARLMQVANVEAVYIKEGIRSFEVIIKGGTDEDIAHALWECRPIGIETSGQIACSIIDSIGQKRIIKFSRPEIVSLTLQVTLKVRRLLCENEIISIKNTFASHAKMHFKLGAEVYPSRFYAAVLDHPQVLDVSGFLLKDKITGNPAPNEIKAHQIAELNFNDIFIEPKVEVVG